VGPWVRSVSRLRPQFQPGTPEELGALLRKDFERYGNPIRQWDLVWNKLSFRAVLREIVQRFTPQHRSLQSVSQQAQGHGPVSPCSGRSGPRSARKAAWVGGDASWQ
jgi:hypothetical protein